ncbi:MAG TPA: serine protease [Candidatus Nanoarchaeia archaeon]|nr:serine protease [Candidatus Nanoarchaeia archaeon]
MNLKKTIIKGISTALIASAIYFPFSLQFQSHSCGEKNKTQGMNDIRPGNKLESIIYSYDNNNCGISDEALKNLDDCVYEITAKTRYFEGEGISLTGIGTGIVLKEGYFLTAEHVVRTVETIESPLGASRDSKPKTRYYISKNSGEKYELEPVVTDKGWISDDKIDFALLRIKKFDENKTKPFAGRLGSSTMLRKGDFLYMLGNMYSYGVNLGVAVVGQEVGGDGYFPYRMLSNVGDSGGAVFALKNKMPELVGLLIGGKFKPGQTAQIPYATGISGILKKISEYKPELVRLWR